MNPMQFIQAMRNGQNPQAMMLSFMQSQMGQSPMEQNLLALAKKGDTRGIEQVVRNLCAQRGLDFDKEFAAFKQQLGLA